ncbi:hypothetical protein [Streptomyces sp. CBMA156]|uniref:hypothetical protein n=1 Tax=Streptomyces sp. CBMA156 TaxID=1930280 RepID=UPI001661FFA5|nr:hypothetical protein [Streptomyces sp. CBMA156]MBD0671952.1 hypothetical protein [Streptomyces sp. CBMA156]
MDEHGVRKLLQAAEETAGAFLRAEDPFRMAVRGDDVGPWDVSEAGWRGTEVIDLGGLRLPRGPGIDFTEFQGRAVPKGGCLQEGLDAVGGAAFLNSAPSALPGGGPKEPLTDPRVVAADRQWSNCMKDRGFTYATPADAYMDPRWRDRTQGAGASVGHTPAELATATADDACKRSTGFMGIAVAVQAAYDRQYIAAHPQEPATFAQGIGRHVADAEKTVAAGTAG